MKGREGKYKTAKRSQKVERLERVRGERGGEGREDGRERKRGWEGGEGETNYILGNARSYDRNVTKEEHNQGASKERIVRGRHREAQYE